jgi:hypothetical protein
MAAYIRSDPVVDLNGSESVIYTLSFSMSPELSFFFSTSQTTGGAPSLHCLFAIDSISLIPVMEMRGSQSV